MTYICVKCQVEMQPQCNGVIALAMAVFGPMELRHADIWTCPSCGFELMTGVAQVMVSHFDSNFEIWLKRYQSDPKERVIKFWLNTRERNLCQNKEQNRSK